MLFKKNNLKDKIETGDTYFRSMQMSAREQALVLGVSNDAQGIPHVHYEKTLVSGAYKDPQGTHVLCLDIFARDFHVN